MLVFASTGCFKHKIEAEVKPIKIEPIQITVDVNIRVQEKLNKFFDFEDEVEKQVESEPAPK